MSQVFYLWCVGVDRKTGKGYYVEQVMYFKLCIYMKVNVQVNMNLIMKTIVVKMKGDDDEAEYTMNKI